MTPFLESLTTPLTPEPANASASRRHPPRARLQHALHLAVASIVGGILTRTSQPSAMRCVFALATDPANAPDARPSASTVRTLRNGLLASVFGQRLRDVERTVALAAGVDVAVAAASLRVAGSQVMAFLDQRIHEGHLGLHEMIVALERERAEIAVAAPVGLARALGVEALWAVPHDAARTAGPPRWSLGALIVLLGLATAGLVVGL